MKVRVVKTKDGKFESEYFSKTKRGWHWMPTYRTLDSVVQNIFPTFEDAVRECRRFTEHHGEDFILIHEGE